jgi:hypothetical protein
LHYFKKTIKGFLKDLPITEERQTEDWETEDAQAEAAQTEEMMTDELLKEELEKDQSSTEKIYWKVFLQAFQKSAIRNSHKKIIIAMK